MLKSLKAVLTAGVVIGSAFAADNAAAQGAAAGEDGHLEELQVELFPVGPEPEPLVRVDASGKAALERPAVKVRSIRIKEESVSSCKT